MSSSGDNLDCVGRDSLKREKLSASSRAIGNSGDKCSNLLHGFGTMSIKVRIQKKKYAIPFVQAIL